MAQRWRGRSGGRPAPTAVVLAGIVLLAGCGTAATPWPTSGSGPLTARMPNGSSGTRLDAVEPGVSFVWADARIYNDGTAAAVVDAFELANVPAGVDVKASGLLPLPPPAPRVSLPDCGSGSTVPPACEKAVAAMPLVGSEIQPATSPGWTEGTALVFVLSVPRSGDYVTRAIRLRYHVGANHYVSTIPWSLEVCAGAEGPGGVCPYPSASPAR